MHRIRPISKQPAHAGYLAPDVKITFIINILEVSVVLFRNKYPQNPIESEGEVEGES
jgi:hypothetical protein